MAFPVHNEGRKMVGRDSCWNNSVQATTGAAKVMGTIMFATIRKAFRMSFLDVLALSVVLVILSPVIWWTVDRTPPVKFIEYGIFPPTVKAGGTIYRVIKVERLRLCETDPDTVIIDGARVKWVYEEAPLLVAGHLGFDEYKRPVVVPLQASPGPSEMRTSATYICNPIHRIWPIKVVGEPLRFTIVE